MIVTLQTTTFRAQGGIPAYNRLVCRVLAQSEEGLDEIDKRVLIAMDDAANVREAAVVSPGLNIEAFSGNRFAFVRRVLGIALSHRIDLLLIGHVNYAPLGLMFRRMQPELRYGVLAYGIEAWDRLTPAKRHALRKANFIISISEYTKQKLAETNGVEASSIKLLAPSLEPDLETSSELSVPGLSTPEITTAEPAIRTPGVKLLSVCRLDKTERYKGIDTVIEALPSVLAKVPQLQYVVIGSGSDLDRHKNLASEKGVAHCIDFPGSVDAETLRAHYRSSDLFIMPSAREGFGIVYLEAMRDRKPVIAANNGAAPEVVEDQKTGLLVEYGNTKMLARAITSLCLDSDLRKRLGEAGHERLQQNFTFEHFKQRLTEIMLNELPANVLNRRQEIGLANSTN